MCGQHTCGPTAETQRERARERNIDMHAHAHAHTHTDTHTQRHTPTYHTCPGNTRDCDCRSGENSTKFRWSNSRSIFKFCREGKDENRGQGKDERHGGREKREREGMAKVKREIDEKEN